MDNPIESSVNPKTFCILPWVHMEARSYGAYAPCCISSQELQDEKGQTQWIYKTPMAEAFQGVGLKTLREKLDRGVRDHNCQTCWAQEDVGQESRRQRENKNYPEIIKQISAGSYKAEQPLFLDLKLGNTCNLKCRICGPLSSSQWMGEFLQTGNERVQFHVPEADALPAAESRQILLNWHENADHFWQTYQEWLPRVEKIEMYGGEPFLIKRNFEVLKKSITGGYSQNQRLFFNSNGTIFPKEAVENIFPYFKSVNVSLSIDGVGSHFEYQRHPAKWDDVIRNYKQFKNSCVSIGICLTVNAMNIFYLPECLNFWKEQEGNIFLNFLGGPEYFSLNIFPEPIKARILEKLEKSSSADYAGVLTNQLEPFVDLLKAPSDPQLWSQFVEKINIHDRFRKESFAQTFPEFFEICKPYWNESTLRI